NIAFNANPLIKLDGYYFLSQLLHLPNLMDRSRAFWRGLFRRVLLGERDAAAAKYAWRERLIYATFGLLSTLYVIALTFFIVRFIGGYLIDSFHLPGLLLTAGVALMFARRPLKKIVAAFWRMITRSPVTEPGEVAAQTAAPVTPPAVGGETALTQTTASQPAPRPSQAISATATQTAVAATATVSGSKSIKAGGSARPRWRRVLIPATLALVAVVILCLPWEASVGSYGTLVAIPGQETIIRAPESATLLELRVRPGDQVAGGTMLGRLGNLEIDEDLVKVQSDLARANADYDRLLGELRTHSESAARAELQLRQRQRDFEEINDEQRQIRERQRAEARAGSTGSMIASTRPSALPTSGSERDQVATPYPAAIAVLQSDVELRRAKLEEANTSLERARKLYSQGLMPRSELDTVERRASTLAIELAGAREKLEAALIEHRRKHTSTATEMDLARSDVGAQKLQAGKLSAELKSLRGIIGTLEDHRELLKRKQSQFELVTPRQ